MSATSSDTGESNTGTFVAALVVAGITVGAFTSIWLVLHNKKNLRRVYQPRLELAPESKRPKELPDGPIGFWKSVISTPDHDIIVANGLDAYLFVRFLKVFGIKVLLPYFLLTFIVCIPLAAAGQTAGSQGLNILTFGNVSPYQTNRRIGHFLVALILMLWTAYTCYKEYQHFVVVRQAWMTSRHHLQLARSRTVAVTNVPDSYNSESALRELVQTCSTNAGIPASQNTKAGGQQSGGVNTEAPVIWMSYKVKDVEKVWEDRNKECTRLEGGVAKMLKLASKNEKKGKTPEKKGTWDGERDSYPAHRYVLPKKVPTWKQGLLGLIGKKMDLSSSPKFIAEHSEKLKDMRMASDKYENGNTVFIRFASQLEAHNFARTAKQQDKSLKLLTSSIEVIPEDIQWSNMSMNPYQRKVGTAISWGLTIGLIIVWAVPVAFVGVVSNVDTLCQNAPFLAWICTIPAPALAIIRGVLPPALLAVLFMLLPIVLRMMVKMQGEIRKSEIELKLFTRFWLFQVIHGFLIVTLASGLMAALGNLGNTASSIPTLLATKLPDASIFFLTFILTATFAGATKLYSRVVPFAMFMLKGILGGNTPRKWYMTTYKMQSFAWATVWPPVCLLICITIVYSVIQPLMTLLALLAFCILYAAYKYQLIWCADQPDYLETGGLFYIRAIRTVFVALYLEGICLAGLFFLSTDNTGARAPSGLACGALMVVIIVLIAGLQIYIDWFKFKEPYLLYVHAAVPSKSGGSIAAVSATDKGPLQNVQTNATMTAEGDEAGAEYGNTSGWHERAFDHPALWKKQPTIWIADDSLGLGRDMVSRIESDKVEASTEYASMDGEGKLNVLRGPPDEAWYGGHSQ